MSLFCRPIDIKMFVNDANHFMTRIREILFLPLRSRCIELSLLLERGNILEQQSVFPVLIDCIFGPQGGLSWGLRTTPESDESFQQLHNFLGPCGALFKCIYNLLKDPCIKYEFPLNYLPIKIRQVLVENASSHPFYSELVQVNPQTKQFESLHLNPFDYYMFHFAYYLINPWHQRTALAINYSWNTAYFILCCDYILHFLPTDPNTQVLPVINYNGKSPTQAVPQYNRHAMCSSLLSPNVLNKCSTENFGYQNLDKHPRNDIWRSETVLTVFMDMWLNNDQVHEPLNRVNNSLNNSQIMHYLHYNELPTGEYMRIVRVFIKQIHAFATSGKADDSHLGELKKITIPMIQGKFYIFIRNLVHRWPLDGSFRLVLELWLTYIQPWRYPPNALTKHLKSTNPDAEDMALGQSSGVEQDQLQFIAHNLLAYVVIFQQLVPRFSRVDLISPKMAIMLYRLTKVFDQPNLPNLLKEVERCVENNHSPSHSYSSQWGNNLPPLSPTSNWSTNTSSPPNKSSGGLNVSFNSTPPTGNISKHVSANSTTFLGGGNFGQPEKKWSGVVRQKIYELEGPSFCYKPLFSRPPASEVYDLIYQIQKSINVSKEIAESKKLENEKLHAGFWGFFKSAFEPTPINDEFTLAERMKVPAYLEFSLHNVMNMFEITEIEDRDSDQNCSTPTVSAFEMSDDYKFLTPTRVRERIKKIKYEGDPDLHPIMSTEITFLVRILYQLALKINEEFGQYFVKYYNKPSFTGRLARQILCEPTTAFSFDKTRPGSPRVAKRLPPRISLRYLASYKLLIYFTIGALLAFCFGFSFITYVLFVVVSYILVKCLKAYPKRHIYPTEGFGNISFNDSF